jgi:hypothetical protein
MTLRKLAVQLLAVILILSLVTGCSLGVASTTTAAPQAVTPSPAATLTATPDPLLAELKAAMLSVQPGDTQPIDQSEQNVTENLREASGARAALGDQADAVFLHIDQAKAAAVQEVLTQVQGISGFTPTSAQSLALAGLLNTLGVAALASMDYQVVTPVLSLGLLAGASFAMDNAPRDANGNTSVPPIEIVTTTKDDVAIYISFAPRMMGSRMEGKVEMILTVTTPVFYEETTKGTLSVELCPDAQGNVPVSFSFTSGSNAGGGGMQSAANTQATGHVDDEAKLDSYDLQSTSSLAAQPGLNNPNGSPNQFVETSFTVHGSTSDPDSTTIGDLNFPRYSSQVQMNFAENTVKLMAVLNMMMTHLALMMAELQWTGGYCLEVQVPEVGPDVKLVQPNSETPFTAHVRHKFEGVELPLPVTATLASGQVAVAPAGSKVPAPAAFTYTAPATSGQDATIKLETRSKRGAAELELKFSIQRLNYQLEFDSNIVSNTFLGGSKGPINVTQHVHTIVDLVWSEQDQAYSGQSELEYVLFDVPPIIGLEGDGGSFTPCPNKTTASGGTFRVLKLEGLMDAASPQPGQTSVSNLAVTLDPGTTLESIIPVCPPPAVAPPGFSIPLTTWPQNFLTMHSLETQMGRTPFIIKDWVAGSGNILAVKTYSVTKSFTEFIKITENTTLTLHQH